MSCPEHEFDILIVGGGMVGATLAMALEHGPYRTGLVETQSPAGGTLSSYDDRSIALSYGASRILHCFGFWKPLELHAEPIKRIHVSDRGHFGITRMESDKEGVPALGYVIASRAFGVQAMARLQTMGGNFRLLCPARVDTVKLHDHHVTVGVKIGGERKTLTTRLLVAADGADSGVRQMLNIPAEQAEYGQRAIIANVTPQRHPHGTAYERFTASGPLAVLPMRNYAGRQPRCAIIWTVPESRHEALMALDDAAFLQALQRHFGNRLGRFTYTGRRSSYPLALVSSSKRIAPRTVFIGNAAQSLHPVAGQGFNLALRDVSMLVDCLTRFEGGRMHAADPGDGKVLERYRQRRRGDQHRVICFTDQLVRLFSNDLPPLAHARSLGLFALDVMPALRRRFAAQAMGLGAPLPHVFDVTANERE
jgi:2-octaprenyl-6-methoxyphenol hydroxylase